MRAPNNLTRGSMQRALDSTVNIITLIGTTHKETGKCTENALYSIIENIDPDVIFEETDQISYFAVYELKQKSNYSMERNTIQKYIENHNIRNIPIDTLEYPQNFVKWNNKIIRDLWHHDENNKALLELMDTINNYYTNNGLESINTEYFDNLIIKKYQLWEYYIYNYRKHLIEDYNKFMNFTYREREIEMVKNIDRFYKEQKKDINAVLLIGADHRISIKEKLKTIDGIEYNFYYRNKPIT